MLLSDYISLFPGATREHPRFMALAEALLRQVMDLQNAVAAIPAAFSLTGAVGAQLDAVAEAMRLSRADSPAGAATTDAQFRAFLLQKMRDWNRDGTNGGEQAL